MKKAFVFLALFLASFSFAPSLSLAEETPFTILAGDVLQITVWKEDGLDREVLVLPSGDITFPLIGTLKVGGHTPEDVQALVKDKLKKFIPDASVTVSVKAALGHIVNVTGQVLRPGEMVINRRMTTLQAISQAGGVTPYADESDIVVIRHSEGKDVSIPIPYDDILSGDELDKDIVLEPGDVIVVPTAGLF